MKPKMCGVSLIGEMSVQVLLGGRRDFVTRFKFRRARVPVVGVEPGVNAFREHQRLAGAVVRLRCKTSTCGFRDGFPGHRRSGWIDDRVFLLLSKNTPLATCS